MSAKFKRHGKLTVTKSELVKIAEKSARTRTKKILKKCDGEIYLTEIDRLNYVYKINPAKNRKVEEIVSVSFSTKIKEEWITVIYYDSTHDGILHRHITVSIDNNNADIPTTDGVRQKGSQHRLLTWAMRDLLVNYLSYKNKFFKRSKITFKDAVDMQYE